MVSGQEESSSALAILTRLVLVRAACVELDSANCKQESINRGRVQKAGLPAAQGAKGQSICQCS